MQGLMSPRVSSKPAGHEVTREGCDVKHRIPRKDRWTAWEDQGRNTSPGRSPGAEVRRKKVSAVQRRERKGVPCRGNRIHTDMEMGLQIHGAEQKEVGLKRGFQINLRRL